MRQRNEGIFGCHDTDSSTAQSRVIQLERDPHLELSQGIRHVIFSVIHVVEKKLMFLQFQREDLETHVQRIFRRLDLNGDGVVTIEEFIEVCQTVGIR